MQVLHEYLILFTVQYFSNASTRRDSFDIGATHSVISHHFIYPQNSTGDF